MNMIAFMDGLIDIPVLFFLFVMAAFLLMVLIVALIAYRVACRINQNTRMDGLMSVSLSLNEWPEDTGRSQSPKLFCGEYLVSMQDPAAVIQNRLDPQLNWIRKADLRRYEVQLLLRRFFAEFEAAGFYQDPIADLLRTLLKDDRFYDRLGTVSRKNGKKGLQHQGEAVSKKDGTNPDRISIYLEIPQEKAASDFLNQTRCGAENIRITLEYYA